MTPEEFVPYFAEGWAKPKPGGFLDHFCLRFHPEARLEQPTLPPARGWAQIESRFRELFAVFPDTWSRLTTGRPAETSSTSR